MNGYAQGEDAFGWGEKREREKNARENADTRERETERRVRMCVCVCVCVYVYMCVCRRGTTALTSSGRRITEGYVLVKDERLLCTVRRMCLPREESETHIVVEYECVVCIAEAV